MIGLILLAAIGTADRVPTRTDIDQAYSIWRSADSEYHECIREQSSRLDDGKSDIAVVAKAAVFACNSKKDVYLKSGALWAGLNSGNRDPTFLRGVMIGLSKIADKLIAEVPTMVLEHRAQIRENDAQN
ncbi:MULTISPECIES: hypothetical protein [Sphingomonas]|uniref:hypothetical protein n=1 Tax=Sphingomonas TaxID=13687 RepID=UPI001051DA22|nr:MULTISPECIES: hypothetical protein [Sphingomonas]